MRILYGVQATGNGHITRARAMLPALQAAGMTVDFVFSGRARQDLFDMAPFGEYRHYSGFTFALHQGRVKLGQTLRQASLTRFVRDVRALDVGAYDWVITDFEPVTAWAAKRQGVRSLGLAHQYALRYRIPGTEHAPWLATAIKAFAPAQYMLGLHWQSFGAPILPPIMESKTHLAVHNQGFVLVYLPFESLSFLSHWLSQIPQQHFCVYAPVTQPYELGNVSIRPLSRDSFPRDLANCAGVLSNTGFGLCSEAMLLGKKILTKPLHRHIEQASNARILQQMNVATVMPRFDQAVLRQWLTQASPAAVAYPDVPTAVAKWLADGGTQPIHDLAASLWQPAKSSAIIPFQAA